MKIPYNVLHVTGNILFAARGGQVHSFSLESKTHVSTWKHPDVEKVANAVKAIAAQTEKDEGISNEDTVVNEAGDDDEAPPAKRLKVEEPKDESEAPVPGSNTAQEPTEMKKNGKGKGRGGKKSRNRQNSDRVLKEGVISRVPDRPVITHLTSTSDGQHLLAISGHDKAIWIFDHDGTGQLTQLSQRTMPKRPSSVVIAPDSQIICADKFGDVYSLPLIPTSTSASGTPVPSGPAPTSKPAFKPSANAKTVHSKRNLRALNDQQRQMELANRTKTEPAPKTDGPEFELTLLLGHVSMLTSLTVGESEGRRYILTGDRDEHIRVSRYIPQAYVIEGFCLGQKEFVSSMTIPASRGEVLVSGGGDEEVFVWDWKAAKLLSKTSVLSLAREIAPELTKVAVTRLHSLVYPTDSGNRTYILATCEDVKAIFSWQLTQEYTLNHPSIIQLPGKPLDLALATTAESKPAIITALDPSDPTTVQYVSIFSLTTNDEKLAVDSTNLIHVAEVEDEEEDIPEKEVRSLLYTTENLRKQGTEHGEGEEAGGEREALEEATVEKGLETGAE